MGLNQTPASERLHIGFFGKQNAGKSSVINAVTGQDLAVVSSQKGTTTDPVYKSMELLPLGPVVMMDTPGIDDTGDLGQLRVKKSYQVLNKTDGAVLVIDGEKGFSREDLSLLKRIREKRIPCVVAFNKADQVSQEKQRIQEERFFAETAGHGREKGEDAPGKNASGKNASEKNANAKADGEGLLWISAATGAGIHELKELLARFIQKDEESRRIVGDLVSPLDFVVLVVPIDKAAPKGRLILPQQQTIRDLLESGAGVMVVRETELKETLAHLGKRPSLVITDSQVFGLVSALTPQEIPLTSFSILFARYKGNLKMAVKGAAALNRLKDGDRILISEGCTHHRQCGDIGSVKLPRWIRQHTGKDFAFEFTSGTEFPEDLRPYGLIVHCGGCMLNEREMKYRQKCAA
ncbi:MAG: [FeFe] hydrogenase H-cluster maturation GTPase HydF, partial [Lachnospiraceae bacterium]|nr:[FeFe] hydrogenase H-cluster maturation GTPase HydF [Lachnospiraceae bacterium]